MPIKHFIFSSQGILVETAEDRRRQQIKDIMNEPDIIDGQEYVDLKFVHVPHDNTLPIRELSTKIPASKHRLSSNAGDILLNELKPYFSALSKRVDLNLFQDQATKQFGSADAPAVSQEALQKVSEEGQVEAFALVHPTESNQYTTVNIYLDEVGMLKRLPLNQRAADLAAKAGFNPPPQFYGDVFLGRVKNRPKLYNVDFTKADTTSDRQWLDRAVMENLEYQTALNQITGRTNDVQPDVAGENGVAKAEEGYTWTQTEEEVEIVVPLPDDSDAGSGKCMTSIEAKGRGLKVKFYPKKIVVEFAGKELLSLDFFARVDPDGCTWTLDGGNGKSSSTSTLLVVTCEKVNETSWPRISTN